jgi:hypothetical protein
MSEIPSEMTDEELMDRLKHLAAQWFNNTDILVLEELFRRYQRGRQRSSRNDAAMPE